MGQSGSQNGYSLLILAGVALTALSGALIGVGRFSMQTQGPPCETFTFCEPGRVGGGNWDKVKMDLYSDLVSLPAYLPMASFRNLIGLAIGEKRSLFHGDGRTAGG